MLYKQDKADFNLFMKALIKDTSVIAPVKETTTLYKKIKDAKQVFLNQITAYPVKCFFFKDNEMLFGYNCGKITKPEIKTEKTIFFGLRRCDLNAIHRQDIAFGEANDHYYKKRRKNAILIGMHCNKKVDKYCFCGSMELKDFHDLMYYDKGNYFLVEIGSKKGSELIQNKKYRKFFKKAKDKIPKSAKKIPNTDRLAVKNISRLYGHPDWHKAFNLCYSCGACTMTCPTCYCFEIYDTSDISKINKGERKRTWSSCQLKCFTRVAGNHIFRFDRENRFKHRIFHQLQYFKEKHKTNLCVGCGRCIRNCPTNIDFVKIINELR